MEGNMLKTEKDSCGNGRENTILDVETALNNCKVKHGLKDQIFKNTGVQEEQNNNKENNSNDNLTKTVNSTKLRTEDLSEGEASSGFETVSSVTSTNGLDYIDISSDNDNLNVIVHVENDLALKNYKEKKKHKKTHKHHNVDDYVSRSRSNTKSRYEFSRSKNDKEKPSEYRKSRGSSRERFDDRKSRYSERNDWHRDRSDLQHCRYKHSHSRDKCRNSDYYYTRSKRSRSTEKRFRSRSKSTEKRLRSRSRSRSPLYQSSRKKRKEGKSNGRSDFMASPKVSYRRKVLPTSENKSSADNFKKWDNIEIVLSSCSDDSRVANDSPDRRKKINFESASPKSKSTHGRPSRFDNGSNDLSGSTSQKNKEPLLVLLDNEKNLKKTSSKADASTTTKLIKDDIKSSNFSDTISKTEGSVPVPVSSKKSSELQLLPSSNKSALPLPVIPINPYKNSLPPSFDSLPTVSMDNLPLVLGPTGLPVHITVAGEQIPYDMDGRRIPIGPNGHYLPLDPSGRLFPHIISPANTAVPIHMTEDGVLRLPNSEPIPFGPPHQLPVNIDGSCILIGPDSKPLYPCANLPKFPPAESMPDTQSLQAPQMLPQLKNNPPGNIYNKEISSRDATKTSRKRVLRSIDVNSNNVLPSNSLKKNTSKDVGSSSNSSMILDGINSETITKSEAKTKSSEGNIFSTKEKKSNDDNDDGGDVDDDDNKLQIACDVPNNENTKVVQTSTKPEDPIIKKIESAINLFCGKDYTPPALGRFIVSNSTLQSTEILPPFESPLHKNRIKLPFITPNAQNISKKIQIKSLVNFKFSSRKKLIESEIKVNSNASKNIANLDCKLNVALQCDFTSKEIKSLQDEIIAIKENVTKLKKDNADLLIFCKEIEVNCDKKSAELKVALDQISKKDSEIAFLRSAIKRKKIEIN